MAKNYLVSVIIISGEHEHRAYMLIKASRKPRPLEVQRKAEYFFSYGDGSTAQRVRQCQEIPAAHAKVLRLYGVANYYSK